MSTVLVDWLNEVQQLIQIGTLSKDNSAMLCSVIESHIRFVLQKALKFQRHGKAKSLRVEDFNSSLASNKSEFVYGVRETNSETSSELINLVELAKQSLPSFPLQPEIYLHWMAVEAYQPHVPENPKPREDAPERIVASLPRETQRLFARIINVLGSSDEHSAASLQIMVDVLERDAGLQEMIPFLSRYIYTSIKQSSRNVNVLLRLIRAIRALILNEYLNLEFHLHQLLPGIFTCTIAAKVSPILQEEYDEPWLLRDLGAHTLSLICMKYSGTFPDLQSRMCKTYLEAIGDDKSFGTWYGGIRGLTSLGVPVVRKLLLPLLPKLLVRLYPPNTPDSSVASVTVGIRNCRRCLVESLGYFVQMNMKLNTSGSTDEILEVKTMNSPRLGQHPPRCYVTKVRGCSDIINSALEDAEIVEEIVPYYVGRSKLIWHCNTFL